MVLPVVSQKVRIAALPSGGAQAEPLLTHEKIGWSHRGRANQHGGVTLIEDEWGKMYKTFGLSAPTSGVDNCVVVHEGNLVLPIGFAEAM